MTTERELLGRVAAWLDEFEAMDHACEGEQDVANCGTCYGLELAADFTYELAELDGPRPLVDVLADFDLNEE